MTAATLPAQAKGTSQARYTIPLEKARPYFVVDVGDDGTPRYASLETLRRWALRGVRGVRLKVQRVGRRLMTNESAVAEFLAALNTVCTTDAPTVAPAEVSPAAVAADRELARIMD